MLLVVGEIASIDRGWLRAVLLHSSDLGLVVGEIASIDRGWLRGSDKPCEFHERVSEK